MIKNHTHNNDSGCNSSIYVLENNSHARLLLMPNKGL